LKNDHDFHQPSPAQPVRASKKPLSPVQHVRPGSVFAWAEKFMGKKLPEKITSWAGLGAFYDG